MSSKISQFRSSCTMVATINFELRLAHLNFGGSKLITLMELEIKWLANFSWN